MLKRKILPSPKQGQVKKLPPRPKDIDEEESEAESEEREGEEEGDEEKEQATVKKGATVLKGKPAGKKSALAAAFDRIPLTNNADQIPAGTYEAIIRDIVMQEPDAKGQSVRVHFELCASEFEDGNNITSWFKIVDSEGESVDGGIRALKQSLAKLGYEVSGVELEECFDEISKEKPGVVLKVSYAQDAQGNTWQRAAIQSTCDNEVVAAYKDNIPY